jgi:hypothetical protein
MKDGQRIFFAAKDTQGAEIVREMKGTLPGVLYK